MYSQKFICSGCQSIHPIAVGWQFGALPGFPCPDCGVYLTWPNAAQKSRYKLLDTLGTVTLVVGMQLMMMAVFNFHSTSMAIAVILIFITASYGLYRFRPEPIELVIIDEIYPPEEQARLDRDKQARSHIDANIAAYRQQALAKKANKAWWQFWL